MQITCPSCQFSQYVPDDKIPARSKVATCPECGNRFQFRELADVAQPDAPDTDAPVSEEVRNTEHDQEHDLDQMRQPPYYGPDGRGLDKPQLETPPEEPFETTTDPFDDTAPEEDEAQSEGMSAAERYLASKGASANTEQAQDDTVFAPQPEGPVQVEVPFEDLENFGFFTGMFHTIKRACFSPRLFFSVMPLRGLIRPLVFAVLLVEFMFVMSAFWQLSGVPDLQSVLMQYQDIQAPSAEETLNPVLLFAVVPLLSLMNLFFNTVVVHGVLAIIGGGKRGFEGTLRVMAYSQAPLFLAAVPFGIGLAVFWSLGISLIGIRSMHSTDWGRTILAHVMLLVVMAFIFLVPFMPASS